MILPKLDKLKEFNEYKTTVKVFIIILFIINSVLAVALPNIINLRYRLNYDQYLKHYVVGQLSDVTVISDSDFTYVDSIATNKRIKAALDDYNPVFNYSFEDSIKPIHLLKSLSNFNKKNSLSNNINVVELFKNENFDTNLPSVTLFDGQSKEDIDLSLKISMEIVRSLLYNGVYSSQDLKGFKKIVVINDIEGSTVKKEKLTSGLVTEDSLRQIVSKKLDKYVSIDDTNRSFILTLVTDIIKSNVYYDSFTSMEDKKTLVSNVVPVQSEVEKGDIILKTDTIVTQKALDQLALMVQNKTNKMNIFNILGSFAFIVIITFIVLYLIVYKGQSSYRNGQYLFMLLVVNLLVQLVTVVILFLANDFEITYVYTFFPIITTSILMLMVTNSFSTSLISGFLISCYLMLLPGSTLMTFFYFFAISIIASYLVSYAQKRIDLIYQWFFTILVVIFISFIIVLSEGTLYNLIYSIGGAIFSVSISYITVFAILPLLEKVFNLPTQFRLRELAYGESPLLNRLAKEAKGTYNHVQIVSDLAYQASKSIGANALLTKVAALYHDVGKLDHPEYFIENQIGSNKHDDIKPTLSSAVIKSHVKQGVEKGREAGLPVEILDIISEHHGNDAIAYFYNKAMQISGDEENISKNDFCYDSNIPSTQESAVVMLADCTEAGTRSQKKVSIRSYERFIDQLFINKIKAKQLLNCDLTMTDLETIKQSFINSLVGRDHDRIEYPDQED